MFEVVRFWLERGVDGLRLDIINALYEDAEFRDNPFSWTLLPSDDGQGMLFRGTERSLDHPDSIRFARELRAFVDGLGDRPRFLIGETISSVDNARRFCGVDGDGLNLVFLFQTLATPLRAKPMRALIRRFEDAFPPPLSPTWVFSNHDRIRRIDRLGGRLGDERSGRLARAKLSAALQLTVRGVPFVYYGEEIGMEPIRTRARGAHDALARYYGWLPQVGFDLIRRLANLPLNRDESRAPMQWDAGPNAGFCRPEVTPWLPVSASFGERNVAVQSRDPDSLWACYQRFLAVRRATSALRAGTLELFDERATPRSVLAYRRVPPDGQGPVVTVLLNMSARERRVVVPVGTESGPQAGPNALVSTHLGPRSRRSPAGGHLVLRPWEGVVLA